MTGEAFGIATREPISACLDCNASSELVEIDSNVFVLQIAHDISCPELARHVHRRAEA